MLEPNPDLQRRIVDAFTRAEEDPPDFAPLLDPFQYVASANYVVPMLVDLAVDKGNEIVDDIPRYSSASHSALWSDLIAAVGRFESFTYPYFNWRLGTDPFAEELLSYEHNKIMRRHVTASFEQGMWRMVQDEHGPRIELAEPIRRSALHLVSDKARFLRSSPDLQHELTEGDGPLIRPSLIHGTQALEMFAEACPNAWERLWQNLPFEAKTLPGFRAFVLALAQGTDRRWFHENDLVEAWEQYAVEHGLPGGDAATLRALVAFHSVTIAEAQEWGIQGAFLRFGEFYAAWFFVFHVLPPDLHFLALLARRYEKDWNDTVGSELALVGDWIGAQLKPHPRLAWSARRRRKGLGDADLALLDRNTGHVLVLELKTVFDKFRTHVQMRNFTEQKVNFPKAVSQARGVAEAVSTAEWPLRELFDSDAPAHPSQVTAGVLTWWDTYNPTLGSSEEMLCCNFETLIYVIDEAHGDLGAAVEAIRDLAGLYCPGALFPLGMTVDGEKIDARQERQGAEIPPLTRLDALGVGSLARHLISDLPTWPDDWQRQPIEDGFARFVY